MRKAVSVLVASVFLLSACSPGGSLGSDPSAPSVPVPSVSVPADISAPVGASVQGINDACAQVTDRFKDASKALDQIDLQDLQSIDSAMSFITTTFQAHEDAIKGQLALGAGPELTQQAQDVIAAGEQVKQKAIDSRTALEERDAMALTRLGAELRTALKEYNRVSADAGLDNCQAKVI